MKIKLLVLFLLLQFQGFSQITYTWVGANYADFGTASNWSPNRDTSRVTDILHFRENIGGDTLLITNYGWGVNSQSNAGQMWVESGKRIVFLGQTFPNQLYGSLLSLYGGDGPVLQVDSNAHFGLYTPEISFATFNPRTLDINPTNKSEVIIDGRISIQSNSNISPGNIYFKNTIITLNGSLDLLSTTQFTNGNFQGVFIANQPGYVYFGNPNYNSKLKVNGQLNYIGGGDQFVNACDSCIEYLNGSKVNVNYSGIYSRNNFTGHYYEGSEINILSLPANQNHVIQLPDSVYNLHINYANPNAPLQIISASTQYNYLRRDVLVKGNLRIQQTGNAFVQFNQDDAYDAILEANLYLDGGKLRIANQGLSYNATRSRVLLNGNFYQSGGELFFSGIAQRFGLFAVKGQFFSNGGWIKNSGSSIQSRIEFNGNNTQTIQFFNQVDDSLQFAFNNVSGYVLLNNLNIGENSLIEISAGSFSGNGRIDYNGMSALCFKNNQSVYATNNKIWSNFTSPAKLIIAGLAGVNLHATRIVSHMIELQKGKLLVNATDTLYLGNQQSGSGTILFNSSSFIIGKFSRWISAGMSSYDYPVGIGNSDRRMQIVYTTPNANAGYITCEFVNAQPGVLGLPINQNGININKTGTEGYWRIRTNGGFNSGLFSIYCLAKQFGGIQNVSNLVLIRREQAGSPFQLIGNHVIGSGSIDSVVLARTNVNNYGDFAVGGDLSQNPLPVELISFTGSYFALDNETQLHWISSSEINVSSYQIERSFDGLNWSKQGEVKAIGNSNSNTNYSWNEPFESVDGIVYYRLKMFDADYSYEYSTIISVKKEEEKVFSLYPNPCSTEAVYLNEEMQIQITDLSARLIYEGTTNFIDVSKFDKGIYLVKSKYGAERLLIQ